MQACKSFFSTGKGKNRVRGFRRYNLVISGRVSQCVLDRIILGWCFHDPTLEDLHHLNFTDYDGYQVSLQFLPMPAEDLWSTTPMALYWLQITEGFVIVFCIKQRESFDKLVDESKFFLQLKEKNDVPLVLVGSEPGYCEPASISGNIRQVTAEEAENFARVLGGRYFEIGAEEKAMGKDHYTPFQHLVREIQRKSLSESVS